MATFQKALDITSPILQGFPNHYSYVMYYNIMYFMFFFFLLLFFFFTDSFEQRKGLREPRFNAYETGGRKTETHRGNAARR